MRSLYFAVLSPLVLGFLNPNESGGSRIEAKYEDLTITCTIPQTAEVIGVTSNSLVFPDKRRFPIGSSIVSFGVGQWKEEMREVSITIMAFKLTRPYFEAEFDIKDLPAILARENMSGQWKDSSEQLFFSSNHALQWVQMTLFAEGNHERIRARTFITPLSKDTVLLVRANSSIQKSPVKADHMGFSVLKDVVNSTVITRKNN